MSGTSKSNTWLVLALAAGTALGATAARGAVFVTTKTADTADGACDRDCSLREAVIAANLAPGQDVVILAPGVYPLTRTGGADDASVGDLDLTGDTVLYGESAPSTILDGGDFDRLLDVPAGVALELVGVTLRNGRASNGGGAVRSQGAVVITRSIVRGNEAVGAGAPGGGIWSTGAESSLSITESTVSGNSAAGSGGGIAVAETMAMVNSTVSGNTAGDLGGGLYVDKDTDAAIHLSTVTANSAAKAGGIYGLEDPFISVRRAHLGGSIVAGNSAPIDRDCSGSVLSDGHNILGDGGFCIDFTPAKDDLEGTGAVPLNPKLGPLAENGGPTPTHALLAGSPAIDQIATCEPIDQRGQTREQPGCDIGAFEVGTECLDGGATLCLNGDRFKVTARWRTPQGATGDAQGVSATDDSGLFWFFGPENLELTVKALDGCGVNGKHWVFLSGLTNVEVTITVTDTQTGAVKTYVNPLGRNFRPVFDTAAFGACP